jgi:hypothetical protein
MIAAYDIAFPMQIADDPTTTLEEHLRALLARLRIVESKAIHQGAAMALPAA